MNIPHSHLPAPEDRAILTEALMMLPARKRAVVELWSYGCTQMDIARELKVSQGTVSRRLKSALKLVGAA